jgi:hypothetical protein
MKTIKEQQDEQRERKLAHVRRKVANGTLVIRQMTAEERERNPPSPREPKRS